MNQYFGIVLAAFATWFVIEIDVVKICYVSAYTYETGGQSQMKRICDEMRDAGPLYANVMINTMSMTGVLDHLVEGTLFKSSAKEALVDVMRACAKPVTSHTS